MFTGIVEQTGIISASIDNDGGRRLTIKPSKPMDDLKIGDSISVNGCCLTVVELDNGCLDVEVALETLRRTSFELLEVADRINLERPLRFSDRLGGHLVSGHVDTTAKIVSMKSEGFSQVITFALSEQYSAFFVEKGSVTVDGVSLTVTDCHNATMDNGNIRFQFSVMLIPHTLEATTLGNLKVGQIVNIETDLVAKYLDRWLNLDIMPDAMPNLESIMRN